MLKRFITWLISGQTRTFVFGEDQVAVMGGIVGGHHAVILADRDDPQVQNVAAGAREGCIGKFRKPVVLKFPTEAQANAVFDALNGESRA